MKKYILIAAAAFSMAACNNDDNIVDEPVAVQVSATIGQGAVSRASNSQWSEADAIGIAMGSRYINMEYVTENGDGVFAGTTMYFRNKREPVTLTAYYPFAGPEGTVPGENGILSGSTAANNQTEAEQPKIDFLFAKVENVTGADPKVKFAFDHRMSKLTLTFINGIGADVSKISSYQVDGLILGGTFDTATGVCAANGDASPLEIGVTAAKNAEPLPSLILFPQPATGVKLTITDEENQVYACDLSFENNELASGNNYKFTITVNKTGLIVDASTITDWTPKESSSGATTINPK